MVLSSSSLVFSSPLTLDLSAGLISQLFFSLSFLFSRVGMFGFPISLLLVHQAHAQKIKKRKKKYLSGKSKVIPNPKKLLLLLKPPKKLSFSQQGLKASDTLQSLSGDSSSEQPEAKEQTAEATPNEIGDLPGAKEENKRKEERNVRFVTSSNGEGDVAAEEDGQTGEEVRDLPNKIIKNENFIIGMSTSALFFLFLFSCIFFENGENGSYLFMASQLLLCVQMCQESSPPNHNSTGRPKRSLLYILNTANLTFFCFYNLFYPFLPPQKNPDCFQTCPGRGGGGRGSTDDRAAAARSQFQFGEQEEEAQECRRRPSPTTTFGQRLCHPISEEVRTWGWGLRRANKPQGEGCAGDRGGGRWNNGPRRRKEEQEQVK